MALTDTEIKKLKATGKDYQKADSKEAGISVVNQGLVVQMIVDGCSLIEIKAKITTIKEAEAVQALIAFGDGSN